MRWSHLLSLLQQKLIYGLKRANADPANLEAARSKIRGAFETTENLNILVGVYTMSPEDHFGGVSEKMVLITFKDGEMVYLP